jgi:hypothetical protein
MRYIVKRYLRARLAHVTRHNLTGAFGFITAGPPVTTVTASPAFLRASFRDRTRPPRAWRSHSPRAAAPGLVHRKAAMLAPGGSRRIPRISDINDTTPPA